MQAPQLDVSQPTCVPVRPSGRAAGGRAAAAARPPLACPREGFGLLAWCSRSTARRAVDRDPAGSDREPLGDAGFRGIASAVLDVRRTTRPPPPARASGWRRRRPSPHRNSASARRRQSASFRRPPCTRSARARRLREARATDRPAAVASRLGDDAERARRVRSSSANSLSGRKLVGTAIGRWRGCARSPSSCGSPTSMPRRSLERDSCHPRRSRRAPSDAVMLKWAHRGRGGPGPRDATSARGRAAPRCALQANRPHRGRAHASAWSTRRWHPRDRRAQDAQLRERARAPPATQRAARSSTSVRGAERELARRPRGLASTRLHRRHVLGHQPAAGA